MTPQPGDPLPTTPCTQHTGRDRERYGCTGPDPAAADSIRHVLAHALGVYYDGNTVLVEELLHRYATEARAAAPGPTAPDVQPGDRLDRANEEIRRLRAEIDQLRGVRDAHAALRPLIERLLVARGRMLEHWADAAAHNDDGACQAAMWQELHRAANAVEDAIDTPPAAAEGDAR